MAIPQDQIISFQISHGLPKLGATTSASSAAAAGASAGAGVTKSAPANVSKTETASGSKIGDDKDKNKKENAASATAKPNVASSLAPPQPPGASAAATAGAALVPAQASEQLSSGRKYVADFRLTFDGLQIPDRLPNDPLTMHQRLEIIQNWHRNKQQNSNINFITANIGFVIGLPSTDGLQKFFVSYPVDHPEKLIIPPNIERGHSEHGLVNFLEDSNTAKLFVENLSRSCYNQPVRIYAIILDINSTFELCGHCPVTFP